MAACERVPDTDESDKFNTNSVEPIGDYTIDPKTGEVRATHTDARGVTTTMRSGDTVVATLPAPFTNYPSATISYATQVQQGEEASVTIEFSTPEAAEKVLAHYEAQAAQAQIEPDIAISAGDTTTLAGTNRRTDLSFALQVTRTNDGTTGQLSVASGLD